MVVCHYQFPQLAYFCMKQNTAQIHSWAMDTFIFGVCGEMRERLLNFVSNINNQRLLEFVLRLSQLHLNTVCAPLLHNQFNMVISLSQQLCSVRSLR